MSVITYFHTLYRQLYRGRMLLLITWLVLLLPATQAQSPTWQAALAVGSPLPTATALGTDASGVSATAFAANGDVYLAGSFLDTVRVGTVQLVSTGEADGFVAKWSRQAARFEWVRQIGGSGSESIRALAVRGNSLYIAGSFNGLTATFGSATLTNASSNHSDAFVARLTDAGSAGAFDWATSLSSPEDDVATTLAVSGTDVFIAGSYRGAVARIGTLTLASYLPGLLWDNGFVAKLTDTGPTAAVQWAQRCGSSVGTVGITALAVAGPKVYIAGNYAGMPYFGATLLVPLGRNTGNFVARLTDAGTSAGFAWAQHLGGPDYDQTTALAVAGANVYIAGSFISATINLGGLLLSNSTPSWAFDGYVAKFTDLGTRPNFVWAQRISGSDDERVNSLAVVGSEVYLAGAMGPGALFGNIALTGTGPIGMYVARLSDLGTAASFVWALPGGAGPGVVGLPNSNEITALAVQGTHVVIGGTLQHSTSFGTLVLPRPAGQTGRQGFLASFDDAGALAVATAATSLGPLVVFPSPAHGTATLLHPTEAAGYPLRVVLLDALGREMREQALPAAPAGTAHQLNLTDLPPGLYAVRVGAATARLLLE